MTNLWVHTLLSVLMTAGAYTYTDSRQQIPLVAGVWQTYEIPRHQYSISATERISPSLTAFIAYVGASNYLASVSGRAFQFDGASRAPTGINYRHPLSEFRALRLYIKADNLFNQEYFENGFRTPRVTFTGGT